VLSRFTSATLRKGLDSAQFGFYRAGLARVVAAALVTTACSESHIPTAHPSPGVSSRALTRADSMAQGYFDVRSSRMGMTSPGALRDAISDGSAAILSVTPGGFRAPRSRAPSAQ
jgi:hypothetical protein